MLENDLTEYVTFLKKSGFYSDDDIWEEAVEFAQDNYEESISKEWVLNKIKELEKEIDKNTTQENFKRLDIVFYHLRMQNIIALHNAGYTISDGFDDANEIASDLKNTGLTPIGCCFYHGQDLERIINYKDKLLLAFGNYTDEISAVEIGEMIVRELEKENFEVEWDHTEDRRIAILNITWDKIYGKEL